LFAARVAAYIKKESGIEVDIDPGGKLGEFTVWVNGKCVEEKDRLKFPDKNKILDAVRKELHRGDKN